MQLTRFLDVSMKDKVDSLLFNGSEFVGGSVDEVVEALNEARGVVKKDQCVSESVISRLSRFSDDKDINEIVMALNDFKKIKNNNKLIKDIEGRFFLRSMNTFNEKCLVLFFIFFVTAFFKKMSFYGVDYSANTVLYMSLYIPLTVLFISVFSGKNKVFEYLEWSLVVLFVRDKVEAGRIVEKMAVEYGFFRITPLSFLFASFSLYLIYLFDYKVLSITDVLIVTSYLTLSLLFFLNRLRNHGFQLAISNINGENALINKNFKK